MKLFSFIYVIILAEFFGPSREILDFVLEVFG